MQSVKVLPDRLRNADYHFPTMTGALLDSAATTVIFHVTHVTDVSSPLPMRIFVAIGMPEAIRSRLTPVCQGLPNVRWVPPENMHCTVRFIGEVDDVVARSAIDIVRAISLRPFTVHVRGVGHFPLHATAAAPDVLWVGIEQSEPLARLVADVNHALTACGLRPDPRPFHAHVTVGRCPKASLNDVRAWCRRYHDFDAGHFTVDGVNCYQSVQTPTGPAYRLLR
ncbi:MAG: RNA 2',3'-cyclic phosphodiesterase [Candidatus Kapabacteria bacterium]|nr:RNA 2',3'-cyclic phosphodiesterase [Candidatus Kapabacteria bacterium]